MRYSRGARGVFADYTYVSGMCRVCIAYVSGTGRRGRGAWGTPGVKARIIGVRCRV